MITLEILWKPAVEIVILWFIIYHTMLFFEGTRANKVVRGIIILVIAFFIFQLAGLTTLDWLMTKLFAMSVLAILVIFQPEIRQGLARLGQRNLFSTVLKEEEIEAVIKQIANAADVLSEKKTGALITIEQKDSLKIFIDSGVHVDARVTAELIQTIFTPNSLLHDGGLVIQHGRIIAAGCIFPLTDRPNLNRSLGTRHRAAIGLTEQTDAIVVVVSEETGNISVSIDGGLQQSLDKEGLFNLLISFFIAKKEDA